MPHPPAYETLDRTVEDGLLTLTLDRPEQFNAVTVPMAEELVDAFARAGADDDVRRALELCYTAEVLDAEQALEAGLVRSLHEPDGLLPAAYPLARRFTDGRSPVAAALTRQMLHRNSAQPHPLEAHRVDSLAMFHTSVSDGKEGVAAFLQKRDPAFTSRASQLPDVWPADA